MTYRFGRTSRGRYAATLAGVNAYQFGAAPMQALCAEGTHLDTSGKCVKDDLVDPLDDTIVIRPKKKKSSKRVPKRIRKRRKPIRRRRRR